MKGGRRRLQNSSIPVTACVHVHACVSLPPGELRSLTWAQVGCWEEEDHTTGPKEGDRAESPQGKGKKKNQKLLVSTVNSNFVQNILISSN